MPSPRLKYVCLNLEWMSKLFENSQLMVDPWTWVWYDVLLEIIKQVLYDYSNFSDLIRFNKLKTYSFIKTLETSTHIPFYHFKLTIKSKHSCKFDVGLIFVGCHIKANTKFFLCFAPTIACVSYKIHIKHKAHFEYKPKTV